MKTGILGGTFNPPHLGHLRLAEEAAYQHGLDRVLLMPSYTPPHKTSAGLAPAQSRLEMTRLACEKNPAFEASDIEIRFADTSYTVKTLEYLKKQTEDHIFFIMGTDSLAEIHTWKEPQRLFELSNYIVVTRPGVSFDEAWAAVPDHLRKGFHQTNEGLIHSSSHRLARSPVRGLEISSTRIRQLVQDGASIRYLVTESTRDFIYEKGLYRK